MKEIKYICDHCGKEEYQRVPAFGIIPKILVTIQNTEVCRECAWLAEKLLQEQRKPSTFKRALSPFTPFTSKSLNDALEHEANVDIKKIKHN